MNYYSRDAPRPLAARSLGPRSLGGPGRRRIFLMASADTWRVGDGAGGAFQPYLDSLRQELQQRDPTLLSVAVAVLAVLLTLGEATGGRGEGEVAELGLGAAGLGGGRRGSLLLPTALQNPAASSGDSEVTWFLGQACLRHPCALERRVRPPPSLTPTLSCFYLWAGLWATEVLR